MSKSSNTSKSRKKKFQRTDKAIVVAIITLIGTILTAFLSSPLIMAWLQKTPSPTITPTFTETLLPLPILTATSSPFPTNPSVTILSPETYLSPSSPSNNNDSEVILTTTPQPSSVSSQPELIKMVFSNPGTKTIRFVIETPEGIQLLQIHIPPKTSQIIYMPSGDYLYWFSEESLVNLSRKISGAFKIESENEYCFSAFSLENCSLPNQ